MKQKICNTVAGTLPAACTAHEDGGAGAPRWFQTFPPYGRYPVGGTVKGAAKDAVFVFDEAAARAVIDDFRQQASRPDWPGVLVDREHFSADADKTSDAMAWARDIRQDADGSIWTRWDFTPEGERLWNDRVLVSRSPLFLSSPDASRREYRPVALRSIGMTNSPHFKDLSTLAAAKAAAEETTNEGEIPMDPEILAALGLAEGAGKEEVLAAIKALKDKEAAAVADATDAKKERDDAVAECRKVQADAFIAANRDRIADEAKCREIYVKDPRGGPRQDARTRRRGRHHRQARRRRARLPQHAQVQPCRRMGRMPRRAPRTVRRLRKEKRNEHRKGKSTRPSGQQGLHGPHRQGRLRRRL